MKLYKSIVIFFLFIFFINLGYGVSEATEKDNTVIAINPILFPVRIYAGELGRLFEINETTYELNVPFYYNDLGSKKVDGKEKYQYIFSSALKIRMYLNDGAGFFFGIGVKYIHGAGSKDGDLILNLYYDYEQVPAGFKVLMPLLEIGHRFDFESGFTISPSFVFGKKIVLSDNLGINELGHFNMEMGIVTFKVGLGLKF